MTFFSLHYITVAVQDICKLVRQMPMVKLPIDNISARVLVKLDITEALNIHRHTTCNKEEETYCPSDIYSVFYSQY